MSIENIKKRYDQAIKNQPKVKEVTTSSGMRVIIRTKQPVTTLEGLQKAENQKYKDKGLNIDKLLKAGFNPDTDNPDDFCCDEYGDEEY